MHELDDRDESPEDARLRAEIRSWLTEHAGPYGRATEHLQLHDTEEYTAACRVWQAELDGGGWGTPTWPIEHGGRGLTRSQARIIAEEQAAWAVPVGAFSIAVAMVGPTLMAHGTAAQVDRFLAPIRQGRHVWCQLFSEPDAGSDLASLRTRAVPDGDDWIVTGQKVWTSGAANADWAILLARTEPGSWRHAGITPASPTSSSTCGRPASRCGRSSRSTATRTSTRSTSTRSASRATR